jgi:hypothetical protein
MVARVVVEAGSLLGDLQVANKTAVCESLGPYPTPWLFVQWCRRRPVDNPTRESRFYNGPYVRVRGSH